MNEKYFLRLCGFGVALSVEAEEGQFRTKVYAEVGTSMWKNLVPGGTRTHDLVI